ALGPPGIVGRVSEVLDAVGRQRRFVAARDVAHPQIPVADERGPFAVGRRGVAAGAVASRAARPARAFDGLLAFREITWHARAFRRIGEKRFDALLGPDHVPESVFAAATVEP